jgi:outer membrane protein
MKKNLVLVTLLFLSALLPVQAQKFGYVDTDFITSKMPEYQKALTEIDKFADKWSKDIQDKYVEIEKLQKLFNAEEILLTEEMKRERQRVISDKEREAREYNNKVFGYEGLLYQKKKDLMKPVMEVVNRAIEKVAVQKKLNFMFDKASDFVMLYTDPRHDYSDYVMEELGLGADQKNAKPAESVTPPAVEQKTNTKPTQKPK